MYQFQLSSRALKYLKVALVLGLAISFPLKVLSDPQSTPLLVQTESNPTTSELSLEQEILGEINRVRTSPELYADWLETTKQYYEGNQLTLPDASPIEIPAGLDGVDQTVEALRALPAVLPLISSETLNFIAQRLVQSEVSNFQLNPNQARETSSSAFSNGLSYGKTAEIIVMQLVMDDNSRANLLQEGFEETGIACQPDEQLDNFCAITYKGVVQENAEAPLTNPEVEGSNGPTLLAKQGTLADGDQVMASDGSLYHLYPIEGREGQTLTITIESEDFDTFIALIDQENNIVSQNDDISEEDSNSEVTVTLPKDGQYYIIVNSYDAQGRGDYTLTVTE